MPKRDTVNYHGLEVGIVSDDEAEQCDYIVCVPATTPSKFTDNFKGVCCHCGVEVIYRWHAPRRPKRICMDCMVLLGDKLQDKNFVFKKP